MSELVERLREGTFQIGLHEDNNTEMFDVSGADDLMFEAAAHIEAQEAELSKARMELITAGCEWQELAEQKQAVEAEGKRLRETLLRVRKALFDDHDPMLLIAEMINAALSPVLIEDGK